MRPAMVAAPRGRRLPSRAPTSIAKATFMIKTFLYSSLLCVASLSAQSEPGQSPAAATIEHTPPSIAPTPRPAVGTTAAQPKVDKNPPALDPANMDKSIKPQDDFFLYANGTWLKNNPIPPEYSRWGSFNELIEKNNDALHEIAEQAAKMTAEKSDDSKLEKAAKSEVQKVGDFYASGMNEAAVNQAKVQPLGEELKRIEACRIFRRSPRKSAVCTAWVCAPFSVSPPARTTRTAPW